MNTLVAFIQAYAKAIVAVLGAGTTAALGVVGPDTDLFKVLTVLAALLTAASVYAVRNSPVTSNGVEKKTGEHVAR